MSSGGAYQPAAGGDDAGAAGADLAAVGGFGPPDRPIAYRCPIRPIPPAAVATPSLLSSPRRDPLERAVQRPPRRRLALRSRDPQGRLLARRRCGALPTAAPQSGSTKSEPNAAGRSSGLPTRYSIRARPPGLRGALTARAGPGSRIPRPPRSDPRVPVPAPRRRTRLSPAAGKWARPAGRASGRNRPDPHAPAPSADPRADLPSSEEACSLVGRGEQVAL